MEVLHFSNLLAQILLAPPCAVVQSFSGRTHNVRNIPYNRYSAGKKLFHFVHALRFRRVGNIDNMTRSFHEL